MLFKLLTLPITGSLDALGWVADKIVDAAEDKLYDPQALRLELEAAEARLERGDLEEAEYEEIENSLIARLREAHARLAAKEARA
jgi:hypothetical protein